ERVRIATQILGSDDKRLLLGHEMFRVKDGERSATQELMFLHIDLAARRVSAFPPDLRDRVGAWTAAHAVLPRPGWAGRRIGLPGESSLRSGAFDAFSRRQKCTAPFRAPAKPAPNPEP